MKCLLSFAFLVSQLCLSLVQGFSLSFGLGAVLFQPRGRLVTKSARGEPKTLLEASDFFVDAFWVGKVGGGATTLSDRQRRSLSNTQFMEFRGRYAGVSRGKSDLVVCELPNGEVVGCAGIEVSPIPKGSLKGDTVTRAPLMSNVAVSRNYRRRGIGEMLVEEAERIARYEWGYDDCYLYVEARNIPAVKLYKKLGYRKVWLDGDAKTLLPTSAGTLQNAETKILCMKKRLNIGALGRFWPF